ncbi:NADH-quinone oxidoreductase subunit J [Niallia endozanthoxylica]|uniref:NADH-quinone oxidoreductase subunit J n=1 Tax=Niallia endozanthoxylica TaxID=2036016 RepID=A0A5J5HY77_9BACI|nr:NADH-quinone oxidoreductase subunit J [Niallia endozanthoxylica]KAA9027813.1 NADH-quinone oxidoreductase subunit J [Niallia endozanthoxylica]
MSGEFLAFIILAFIAVSGGVLLLNLTKVVHMVLALVATFISIAGIYILLSAEFLAVVQILIYSGAITIIMLFGIMLTRHDDKDEPKGGWVKKGTLFLGVAGFAAVVYLGIYNLDFPQLNQELHVNNTEQIGIALYTKYIIPFELTSIVLLVALIGAIILAKRDDKKEADE